MIDDTLIPIATTEREDEIAPPPRKKIKLMAATTAATPAATTTTTSSSTPLPSIVSDLVNAKKKRLSKFALRLFDPNRIKGVVQVPDVIPLNDEFLKAFGARERKFDTSVGRILDIETNIPDDAYDIMIKRKEKFGGIDRADDDEDDDTTTKKKNAKPSEAGRKIKITNLKYTTTAAMLQEACQKFGPVVEVNLMMDMDRQDAVVPLNIGRAFVIYQTAESAQACFEKQLGGIVDGRLARCTMVEKGGSKRGGGGKGGMHPSLASRYWQLDISTKCFRCGKVGHISADCTNEAKPLPCPLCAKTDHDIRNCPVSRVCFNCGIPGHVSRECPQPRGQPTRRMCSICFQSGHHRLACRQAGSDAPAAEAICLLCGKRGHYLCKDMTFFFGLDGVSCFNCGLRGHLGYDCTRPLLEILSRDDRLASQEIVRGEAFLFEDLEKEMVNSSIRNVGPRGRPMHQKDNDNRSSQSRSKSSAGARPRGYRGYANANGGGGSGGGGSTNNRDTNVHRKKNYARGKRGY